MPKFSAIKKEYPQRIKKEDINQLPLTSFEGKIHLIHSDEDIEDAVSFLKNQRLLGFDTETRPTFKKGVSHPTSLIQLSTEHDAYIFQLLQLENIAPIYEVLEDPGIEKVGVAIRDDIRKLQDLHPFRPAGFIEIADITKEAQIINTGLRSLAAIFMGVRISKQFQVSNWSKPNLSPGQIQYAATDAWISRCVYQRLREIGF